MWHVCGEAPFILVAVSPCVDPFATENTIDDFAVVSVTVG